MTIGELAKLLNLSENYIKYHWSVVVERQKRRGVELTKIGRGTSASYSVKFPDERDIKH